MSEIEYDKFKSEIDKMAKELKKTGNVVGHKINNNTEEQLPLSMEAVKQVIGSLNKNSTVTVNFINIKNPSDYENFFQTNKQNRKEDKISFYVILEGEENPKPENRYHFLLLMNCMKETYIFDSIGRGKSSVSKRSKDAYSDWDKNLLDQVEKHENTFVTDTELQKDSESCADYVIEFFRNLIDQYKTKCKRKVNLFSEYISSFFDRETRSEKKLSDPHDDKVPFSILPTSFLELSQSSKFIGKYVGETFYNEFLGPINKEINELEEKSKKTFNGLQFCQNNIQKITEANKSGNENKKNSLVSYSFNRIKEKESINTSQTHPQTEEEKYEYVIKFFESKSNELETEYLKLENNLQIARYISSIYYDELKFIKDNFPSVLELIKKSRSKESGIAITPLTKRRHKHLKALKDSQIKNSQTLSH